MGSRNSTEVCTKLSKFRWIYKCIPINQTEAILFGWYKDEGMFTDNMHLLNFNTSTGEMFEYPVIVPHNAKFAYDKQLNILWYILADFTNADLFAILLGKQQCNTINFGYHCLLPICLKTPSDFQMVCENGVLHVFDAHGHQKFDIQSSDSSFSIVSLFQTDEFLGFEMYQTRSDKVTMLNNGKIISYCTELVMNNSKPRYRSIYSEYNPITNSWFRYVNNNCRHKYIDHRWAVTMDMKYIIFVNVFELDTNMVRFFIFNTETKKLRISKYNLKNCNDTMLRVLPAEQVHHTKEKLKILGYLRNSIYVPKEIVNIIYKYAISGSIHMFTQTQNNIKHISVKTAALLELEETPRKEEQDITYSMYLSDITLFPCLV